MTTRRLRLVNAAVLAACLTAAVIGLRRAGAATRDLGAARGEHAAVLADARTLLALQGSGALVGERPRAESDLVGRVHAVLHAAGIDPSALTQVSSTEPKSLDGAGGVAGPAASLRRQQSALTIDSVQPGDLGRFLGAWRRDEPLWVVRSVRLDHSGKQPAAGEQNRFTAVLTLENVFVENRPLGREGVP